MFFSAYGINFPLKWGKPVEKYKSAILVANEINCAHSCILSTSLIAANNGNVSLQVCIQGQIKRSYMYLAKCLHSVSTLQRFIDPIHIHDCCIGHTIFVNTLATLEIIQCKVIKKKQLHFVSLVSHHCMYSRYQAFSGAVDQN